MEKEKSYIIRVTGGDFRKKKIFLEVLLEDPNDFSEFPMGEEMEMVIKEGDK